MKKSFSLFIFLILGLFFSSCTKKINKAPVEIIETKKTNIYKTKIQKKEKKIIQNDKVETKVDPEIAIFVPLQGDAQNLGLEMGNLIKLGIQNSGYKELFNISLYDSSSIKVMYDSVSQIKSKNTNLILGPNSSEAVKSINTFIDAKIPIITLSNNINLVKKTGSNLSNVYIFGHIPMKQTNKIISHMIQRDISRDIILLLPESSQNLVKILENTIKDFGGNCVLVKQYKDLKDMDLAVNVVNDFVSKFNENPSNHQKLGIYIADSKKNLSHLLSLIQNFQLDKMANIFGDNRLDIKEAQNLDIFYTGYVSFNKQNNDFAKLDYMHKLAYDLGLYVGHALQGENLTNYLNDSGWIEGMSGYFKMEPSHVSIRKYHVLKRQNGQIKILEDID